MLHMYIVVKLRIGSPGNAMGQASIHGLASAEGGMLCDQEVSLKSRVRRWEVPTWQQGPKDR